jgi:hypothetical protein
MFVFIQPHGMKNKKEGNGKTVSETGGLFKGAPSNPADNVLKPGIAAKDVVKAISSSGYPLQSVVARKLRKHFGVQEEWSFVDTEERIARSIDLFTEIYFFDLFEKPQPRILPVLNLIVECKRSELPYVFFLTDQKVSTPRFPLIAGYSREHITVSTDDNKDAWPFNLMEFLGLNQHAFLGSDVASCTTFSRCERKGSKFQLSGSEPYNSLVQPLVKALEYFRTMEEPPKTAVYYDLHLVLGLAVLEAPMVGVLVGTPSEPLMLPWVRIPRHHVPKVSQSYEHRRNIYAIDVVHVAFLETYIEAHLWPFASELARLAHKHHLEIADGEGVVPGTAKNWHHNIEELVTPTKDSQRRYNFYRMLQPENDTLVMIPGLDSGSLAEVEALLQAAGIEYAQPPDDLSEVPPCLKGVRPGLFVKSSELSDVKKVLAEFRIRTPKGDLVPIPW